MRARQVRPARPGGTFAACLPAYLCAHAHKACSLQPAACSREQLKKTPSGACARRRHARRGHGWEKVPEAGSMQRAHAKQSSINAGFCPP